MTLMMRVFHDTPQRSESAAELAMEV